MPSSTIAFLKQCTYVYVNRGKTQYQLVYDDEDDVYWCPPTGYTIAFRNVSKESLEIDWIRLAQYVRTHATPRKVMKMFLVKILGQEYEEPMIPHIVDRLVKTSFVPLYRTGTLIKYEDSCDELYCVEA